MAAPSVSTLVRRHRHHKAWTQKDLGEALGVSQQAVSQWEAGSVHPQAEIIDQLARELGMRGPTLRQLIDIDKLVLQLRSVEARENAQRISVASFKPDEEGARPFAEHVLARIVADRELLLRQVAQQRDALNSSLQESEQKVLYPDGRPPTTGTDEDTRISVAEVRAAEASARVAIDRLGEAAAAGPPYGGDVVESMADALQFSRDYLRTVANASGGSDTFDPDQVGADLHEIEAVIRFLDEWPSVADEFGVAVKRTVEAKASMRRPQTWRTIADKISSRVDSLGLTRAEIARASKVSPNSFQRLLDGAPTMGEADQSRIALALGWRWDAIPLLALGEEPMELEPGFEAPEIEGLALDELLFAVDQAGHYRSVGPADAATTVAYLFEDLETEQQQQVLDLVTAKWNSLH